MCVCVCVCVCENNDPVQMQVQGYVRGASQAGVFVTLSRGIEARVRLANLAEGYVEDPVASFPVGKHVRGWVLSCAADK